jgi:hypothetical protein
MTTTFRTGAALAAAILIVAPACSDTPTGATAVDREATFEHKGTPHAKLKPTFHYARVRGDGGLVDGTATSSIQSSTGRYLLTFPPPIGKCAASAISASFVGFDGSVFRIVAQVSIGFDSGGAFDDQTVTVSTFNPASSAAENTSFTLILLCP